MEEKIQDVAQNFAEFYNQNCLFNFHSRAIISMKIYL